MTKDKMVGWHHQLNGHEFAQTLADNDCSYEIERRLPLGREAMNDLAAYQKAEALLCQQSLSSQSYSFSSSHVWMCELDYKESWAPKD